MPSNTEPESSRDYDAHIYFEADSPTSTESARKLNRKAWEELSFESPGNQIIIRELRYQPIGPHPLPMFEINFGRSNLEKVLSWLIQNRGMLPVLIHPVTGNDMVDHSSGAMWLGYDLTLNKSSLSQPDISFDYSRFTPEQNKDSFWPNIFPSIALVALGIILGVLTMFGCLSWRTDIVCTLGLVAVRAICAFEYSQGIRFAWKHPNLPSKR